MSGEVRLSLQGNQMTYQDLKDFMADPVKFLNARPTLDVRDVFRDIAARPGTETVQMERGQTGHPVMKAFSLGAQDKEMLQRGGPPEQFSAEDIADREAAMADPDPIGLNVDEKP